MKKLTFGEQLILLRRRRGLTQGELAEKAGILREMISSYESGKVFPREGTLKKIADVLGVDFEELYGYLEESKNPSKGLSGETQTAFPKGSEMMFKREGNKLEYIETVSDVVTLPVLGHVHAGNPNFIPDREIIDLIKLPRRIGRSADYALIVTGMSMVEAGINEGDTVLVKNQPDAENSQIVIARVGSEDYTIKRLKKNEKGEMWLEPANSRYKAIKGKSFEIVGLITYVIKKVS